MRRAITVDRILDEAQLQVAREGLESLRMADLARALRVKPPSLYKHVPDLNSVRIQLAQRGWNALSDLFAELGRADSEPRQLGRRWWRFVNDNPVRRLQKRFAGPATVAACAERKRANGSLNMPD